MTAALSDHPPSDGWTTDDLDALPDDGFRRELLDGVLLVSPSPTNVHQILAARLVVALEESCPGDLEVTQANEVRISARRSFIPDVLVTTDEAARRGTGKYSPEEVVLAVEIVSPTSQSMDRVMKPALYAKAGIPHYWLVETQGGLVVQTYRLDPEDEVYHPSGTFTDVIEIAEPWQMEIPVARLRPRHL
ncbi:Uma2 family endonuclease [Nucisporomicrobium flavum]|jgi:Uma2 family endonuclease|uniref:Uma2 family endonuclease n=1 Tax=Nucisporomicrobium flavum TaxID=2785915 RepID=UPI0018F6E889|nr:Uma2 family endonuclease [Nucisporomicrobium flavum]